MTKSAKTRALEVCQYLNLPAGENGIAFRIIYGALLEHERDTRHACAEAISRIPRGRIANTSEWDAINMDAAHAACMNAKVE